MSRFSLKHMELKLPTGSASRENQEALQYKEITAYTHQALNTAHLKLKKKKTNTENMAKISLENPLLLLLLSHFSRVLQFSSVQSLSCV